MHRNMTVLRFQESVCAQLQVFIMTNRFREDLPEHYESRVRMLEVPSDSTLELAAYAVGMLRMMVQEGCRYKKAGVILSEISPKSGVQSSLFDTVDREKHDRAMKAIDALNGAQGRGAVRLATEGGIKMNRNHLSGDFTTDWSGILVVKAKD